MRHTMISEGQAPDAAPVSDQRDLDDLPNKTRGRLGPHSAGVAPPAPASPILRAARPGRFGPAACGGAVGLGVAHGHWCTSVHAAPSGRWQVKVTEQAHPVEPAFEPEAACPEPLGLSC